MLRTYPNVTVEQLAVKADIDGLAMCEAITANQLAICNTAHGDNMQITNFFRLLPMVTASLQLFRMGYMRSLLLTTALIKTIGRR